MGIMARTAQEHLDELLEQRDLLVDQLSKVDRYAIDKREVERKNITKKLLDVDLLIVIAEKRVSASRGPARSLLRRRRR